MILQIPSVLLVLIRLILYLEILQENTKRYHNLNLFRDEDITTVK